MMTIPQADILFADLIAFVKHLAHKYNQGDYQTWEDFAPDVRAYYTPERMDAIDSLVKNWKVMASYADQVTLIHVTGVLAMLVSDPQFEQASPEQKNLLLWIVLFHDVGKVVNGKRDPIHALTSACYTMQALEKLGFVSAMDESGLADWVTFTRNATCYDAALDDQIADNRKLPEIMAGIEQLCGGKDSPAGLLVCGVLFHMSITVVEMWPAFAPLSDSEIRAYISSDLFPLVRIMMEADGASWEMFKPDVQAAHRIETQATFRRLAGFLGY